MIRMIRARKYVYQLYQYNLNPTGRGVTPTLMGHTQHRDHTQHLGSVDLLRLRASMQPHDIDACSRD